MHNTCDSRRPPEIRVPAVELQKGRARPALLRGIVAESGNRTFKAIIKEVSAPVSFWIRSGRAQGVPPYYGCLITLAPYLILIP